MEEKKIKKIKKKNGKIMGPSRNANRCCNSTKRPPWSFWLRCMPKNREAVWLVEAYNLCVACLHSATAVLNIHNCQGRAAGYERTIYYIFFFFLIASSLYSRLFVVSCITLMLCYIRLSLIYSFRLIQPQVLRHTVLDWSYIQKSKRYIIMEEKDYEKEK
jgi:hypothetical protein